MIMKKQKTENSNLTLLGNQEVAYSFNYNPGIMEVFDNKHPDNDYWVKFNCPEFTSLCPITGQPDFAHLVIDYGPEFHLLWTVFLDESGECWTFSNPKIRAQKNITLDRNIDTPTNGPPLANGHTAHKTF